MQIERTLAELAALFADVAAVVEQQDEVVEDVERDVGKAVEYLDDGIEQVRQATVSAKRAKRLKWWCVLVGILILLIVAVVILLLGKFVFRWF